MVDSIEELEEFIKESFKEIMTSLQRQETTISSMVKSYSLLNIQPNQELTIIVQEPFSPLTPTQTPSITSIHQSFLSNPSQSTSNTLKKHKFLGNSIKINSSIDFDEKRTWGCNIVDLGEVWWVCEVWLFGCKRV